MTFNIKYNPDNFSNLVKYGMKYPYMTYDKDSKAIYLGLREGKYFQSKTISEDYYTKDHMINIDYDKNDNILGIEILLPRKLL